MGIFRFSHPTRRGGGGVSIRMTNPKFKQVEDVIEKSNNMRERERKLISRQHRDEQLVAAMRSRLSPALPGESGVADGAARSKRASRLRGFDLEKAA